MQPSALIEALLFSRAEPWTLVELAKTAGLGGAETAAALEELEAALAGRGIVLVRAGDGYTLGTHPAASAVLEQLYKEELSKGLSKASVETLSIIMYGSEVTRGKIDYIRGVNSGFILRALMVRGLIERIPYPRDRKKFMYVPTVALLASLGAENAEALPEYARIHAEIEKAGIGAELSEETADAGSERTA